MAVQKAIAISEYINTETGDINYHGGGGGGGGSSTSKTSTSNSNVQISSNSALESLLKITNVLKESLGVSEKSSSSNENINKETSVYVNETINKETSVSANETITKVTKTSNGSSYLLTINPTSKTYITSYIPKTTSYIKPIVVNLTNTKTSYINWPPVSYVQPKIEDLLTKGKLTFEKKVTISYQYSYNLQNIIPNPLYNQYINDKYNDDLYATGDLDGERNTTYLQLNKNNISNQISKDYYIPSIGELGISMENIQKINDSIEALGEEYSQYKIPYNSIIASSSLYSQQKVINSEYHITNNINNVWCFNNNNAQISYSSISNKFTIIPFYKFENNIKINLDEDIEDIVVNSIVTLEKYDPNMYYELNSPINNYQTKINNLSDFNIDNWLEHPFNPKYFFNISFPEVKDYLKQNNNFIKLHDNYLPYYEYYSYYIKFHSVPETLEPIETKIKTYTDSNNSNKEYCDVENDEFAKKNLIWNNGISYSFNMTKRHDYVSYIRTNESNWIYSGAVITYSSRKISDNEFVSYNFTYYPYRDIIAESKENYDGPYHYEYQTTYISYQLNMNYNDYWKHILIYNVPIYNNHLILTPIYGSGEQIYNCKKNKAKSLFYITIPSSCTKFECKMNNTTDCNISMTKYLELNGFTIYCISLNFKVDVPTDNMLIFSCYYKGNQITKKYFYSIYSLLISNALYNKEEYTTYFNIENYYVAKDPYYWWKVNNWSYLNNKNNIYINKVESSIDNSSHMTLTKYSIKDSFGKLFDTSFDQVNNRFIAYSYSPDTGINLNDYWVSTSNYYVFNTYTYNKYNSAFKTLSNAYFNSMYDMSYLINSISRNIGIKDNGTVQDRGLRVDRMIDSDILNNSIYNKDENNINSLLINDHNTYVFIKGILSECSYIYYEPKYEFRYTKPSINANYKLTENPILTNNYHMLSINTYILNPNYHKHDQINYLNFNSYYNSSVFYKPIIRINRNIDNFGLYNDLIFTYIPKYYKSNKHYPSNYMMDNKVTFKSTKYYSSNHSIQERMFQVIGKNNKSTYLSINIGDLTSGNINRIPNYNSPYLYTLKGNYSKSLNGDYLKEEYSWPANDKSKIRINIPVVGAKQSICLGMDMVEYINIGLFRKVLTDDKGRIYSKNIPYNSSTSLNLSNVYIKKINKEITKGLSVSDLQNNNFFNEDTQYHYFFENGFNSYIYIKNDGTPSERLKSSGWYYTFDTSDLEDPNQINNYIKDKLQSIYDRIKIDYQNSFLFDYTYYYNYIFSDYIFLYNNTNTVVSLLVSDPSLTLINKQHAQIQLKPYELKVYYPSNFNYNNTNNFNKSKIYTLRIINKTDSIFNMEFNHYKLGEYNLSFNEMYDIFIKDNNDIIEYFNSGRIIIPQGNQRPKFRLNGIMPDQIGYKLVTNLLGLCHNYDENNPYTKDQILNLYYNILIYKSKYKDDSSSSELYDTELSKSIHNKLISDTNILSTYVNTLNIDIQNYSENKAGHLIVIESAKKFKSQISSSNINDLNGLVFEERTYYYYIGWKKPTTKNIEEIIKDKYPTSDEDNTLNNAGKELKYKSSFGLDSIYNPNGSANYYVLIPTDHAIYNKESSQLISNDSNLFTSSGEIIIGNQIHIIYTSTNPTNIIKSIEIK